MTKTRLNDELQYHLLKLLDDSPQRSQRELAQEMNVSLGKANYCLRALRKKGFIKAESLPGSRSKRAYAYYLTPQGAQEKARLTVSFLKSKISEYQTLKKEIQSLKIEVNKQLDSNK